MEKPGWQWDRHAAQRLSAPSRTARGTANDKHGGDSMSDRQGIEIIVVALTVNTAASLL